MKPFVSIKSLPFIKDSISAQNGFIKVVFGWHFLIQAWMDLAVHSMSVHKLNVIGSESHDIIFYPSLIQSLWLKEWYVLINHPYILWSFLESMPSRPHRLIVDEVWFLKENWRTLTMRKMNECQEDKLTSVY